jgi:hypothetical protein
VFIIHFSNWGEPPSIVACPILAGCSITAVENKIDDWNGMEMVKIV